MKPQAALSSGMLPAVRGRYTENAPLGENSWFRCGGRAEILFKPEDRDDLSAFLSLCPPDVSVTVLGVMSNTIVRDGGIRGVVIRLGREFAGISANGTTVEAGAAALDGNVANAAAKAGIGGLEFFSGIPGTVGGALRMNAGCYGSETRNVLVVADAVDRQGRVHTLRPDQMGMTYRRTSVPDDYIFTRAVFQGIAGDPDAIRDHIADIKAKRTATQPIREKTGGSTFANPDPADVARAGLPEGTKSWQLVDRVGGRGLRIGGAMMSELHANFMINTGAASAADLEALGEEIIRRVRVETGITLHWEIKRIGEALQAPK